MWTAAAHGSRARTRRPWVMGFSAVPGLREHPLCESTRPDCPPRRFRLMYATRWARSPLTPVGMSRIQPSLSVRNMIWSMISSLRFLDGLNSAPRTLIRFRAESSGWPATKWSFTPTNTPVRPSPTSTDGWTVTLICPPSVRPSGLRWARSWSEGLRTGSWVACSFNQIVARGRGASLVTSGPATSGRRSRVAA